MNEEWEVHQILQMKVVKKRNDSLLKPATVENVHISMLSLLQLCMS